MPQRRNVEKAIRLLQEIQVLKLPDQVNKIVGIRLKKGLRFVIIWPPGEQVTNFRDPNKSERQIWNLKKNYQYDTK